MAGHVACMGVGEMKNQYKILIAKPEGKRALGRPRRRREENILMNIQEIRFGGVDWINVAQEKDWWWAFANMVMNHRIP
jgi:hypothetical protein